MRWLGRLLIALVVAAAALAVWKGAQIARTGRQAQGDADAALRSVTVLLGDPSDPDAWVALGPALEAAAESVAVLRSELQPVEPFLRLGAGLPAGVSWVADLPDALGFVAPLSRAAAMLAEPLATVGGQPMSPGAGRYLAVARALEPAAPEIERQLAAAEPSLNRLRGRPLAGPLERLRPLVDRAPEAVAALRQGLPVLGALGPALGADGPRSYLLVGQNSYEIRATGGFIGSVGRITLDGGAITELDYGSSYHADEGVQPPSPPGPLARYLGLGGWYLRDANWWPDFPASAAQIEQAWTRAGHPPVDGIIAFDTSAIEAALRGVGPIEVAGYGAVSAETFERQAAEQLYSYEAVISAGGFHEAKAAFLAPLGRALVERLTDAPPAELLRLQGEALRLLSEKHVLLAFKDPSLVRLAYANGWDGAIRPVSGNYLYVVDTTVSYGDTYRFVTSDAELRVTIGQDGRHANELVLRYDNSYPRGLPDWMPAEMVEGATFDPAAGGVVQIPGFWGNWLRVYLPAEASGVTITGVEDPRAAREEFGRRSVAGYLPVPPGEGRVVTLGYTTPASEQSGERGYRLFFQKQPGLQCRPLSLSVRWPDGDLARYRSCPTVDQRVDLGASQGLGSFSS